MDRNVRQNEGYIKQEWVVEAGLEVSAKAWLTSTRPCVNSGSWWWAGRPSVLRFMGSQRVGHDWVAELTDWLTICKTDNQWEFAGWCRELKLVLCDNLEGWDQVGGGRRFKREGPYLYTYDWFTLMYGRNQHNIVKAIILPLKINLKFLN